MSNQGYHSVILKQEQERAVKLQHLVSVTWGRANVIIFISEIANFGLCYGATSVLQILSYMLSQKRPCVSSQELLFLISESPVRFVLRPFNTKQRRRGHEASKTRGMTQQFPLCSHGGQTISYFRGWSQIPAKLQKLKGAQRPRKTNTKWN